jgi:hypothetical protein
VGSYSGYKVSLRVRVKPSEGSRRHQKAAEGIGRQQEARIVVGVEVVW